MCIYFNIIGSCAVVLYWTSTTPVRHLLATRSLAVGRRSSMRFFFCVVSLSVSVSTFRLHGLQWLLVIDHAFYSCRECLRLFSPPSLPSQSTNAEACETSYNQFHYQSVFWITIALTCKIMKLDLCAYRHHRPRNCNYSVTVVGTCVELYVYISHAFCNYYTARWLSVLCMRNLIFIPVYATLWIHYIIIVCVSIDCNHNESL